MKPYLTVRVRVSWGKAPMRSIDTRTTPKPDLRVRIMNDNRPSDGQNIANDGDLTIRLMRDNEDDYALMARWLSDPRVLEFYEGRDNPHDIDMARKNYGPLARGDDATVPCIMALDGAPIGYLQYYPVGEEGSVYYGVEVTESTFGIDLFIGEPEWWNRGVGTRALSALVDYLFQSLGARRIIIDPRVTNHRAIRSYEKCGFRKVKVIPKQGLFEGRHTHSWLMTLERKD